MLCFIYNLLRHFSLCNYNNIYLYYVGDYPRAKTRPLHSNEAKKHLSIIKDVILPLDDGSSRSTLKQLEQHHWNKVCV